MQKGQTQVLILAGIVILIAAAGGIFFLGRVTAPKPQVPVTTSSPQPSPLSTEAPAKVEDPTANWKTYTNKDNNLSLKYPATWVIEKEDQTKEFAQVIIKGLEGEINVYWGERGIGGASCYSLYGKENEKIQISGENLNTCHVVDNGIEKWLDINKQLGQVRFNISASANPPLNPNRDIVLKVISTFRFD